MDEDEGWIEGPAIEIALQVKALKKGDEIFCAHCYMVHPVVGWHEDALRLDASPPIMPPEHFKNITAWRPK